MRCPVRFMTPFAFVLMVAAAVPAAARDLPARWDWNEQGKVTPAREFGLCNSTWCFAAVGAVEAMLLIHEGRATDLSEQQILACATPGRGCHGGWMDEAYRFIRDHGVAAEDCFPYNGSEAVRCEDHACVPVATIADWVDVPHDRAAIKAALLEGPVSTVMFVPYAFLGYDGSFCFDGSGPATSDEVGVLIVGWDDALCGGGGWICKGCFGADWGAAGFFTVAYEAFGIGAHAQRPVYSDGRRLRGELTNIYDGDGGGTGNGDGWPGAGETPLLALSLRNGPLAPARTGVTARLTLLSGPATLAPIDLAADLLPAGATAALLPLAALAIDRAAAPGDTVRLRLAFTADGAPAGDDTLSVPLGTPAVLVVGDDEGERLEQRAVDSALRVGYPLRVWRESRQGPVSTREMQRYRAVVWNEGVLGRLGLDNVAALSTFLEAGGHLFISGQDIGWWLVEYGHSASELWFYEHYLQAEYIADASGTTTVTGVGGDLVGHDLNLTLGPPGGLRRPLSPDVIAPAADGVAAFTYAPGLTAAVRSTANGRVLYTAFGFDAIVGEAARDTLMARSLRWLAGPPPDLAPPRVVLLEPRGGESFAPGSVQSVHWRGQDDRGIVAWVVERSRDDGATWPDLLGWFAPTDSACAWAVGDSTGEAQRIRVSATDAAGLWGVAMSGRFRVGAPMAALRGTLSARAEGSGARVELAVNLPDTTGLAVERRGGADSPVRRWQGADFAAVTRDGDGLRAVVIDDEPAGWPRAYSLLRRVGDGEVVLDRIVFDGSPPPLLRVEAWPNPFNPRLTVRATTPRPGRIVLEVYDPRGRLVRTLWSGETSAGSRVIAWDGSDEAGRPVASGAYELRLRDAQGLVTRRITLIR